MLVVQYYCALVIHREGFGLLNPASARISHASLAKTSRGSVERMNRGSSEIVKSANKEIK
jgi:hypothetical protein